MIFVGQFLCLLDVEACEHAVVRQVQEIYTEVPSAATRAALKKLSRWLDR